ncbi:MAG: cytochrome C [Gammaproteobacteria bacterium]|nr:cytochrome C [Gammaproteobacteria bacterium]
MRRFTRFKIASGLIAAAALFGSMSAEAVPSFARQTGLPCQSCHTVFPELTNFGRLFKLNGYTLTGLQQIQMPSSQSTGGLKINETPPLSAMLQAGFTHDNRTQPGTQNNDVEFPQQLSFFFAGEISPHIGSFIQITYSQPDDHFAWDNTDIRYANHFKLAGKDTIYGLDLNNAPGVEDVWNNTPIWRFPFAASDTAAAPAADALIDGGLAQDVAGVGVYTLWNQHLYANVEAYRSAHIGQQAPSIGSTNTIRGAAPYWRLAWQQYFDQNYLEAGVYGLYAELYPNGVNGATDKYTDWAADTQYERPFGEDLLSVHATYIHEHQNLKATFGAGGSANPANTLRIFRADGTYHFGNRWDVSLGYFQTTGTADTGLYNTGEQVAGSVNGVPNSRGYIAEVNILPWQNTKFGLQYTGYTKFNGAGNNYDGFGRSASDNNSVFLLAWLMW